MNISGKKAVVFGGTSGIGLAATKMLAKAGATVVAISRDPTKAGSLPAGVTVQSCDVRDGTAIEALLKGLAPFDILVSAATGGDRAIGRFSRWIWKASKGRSTSFGAMPMSSAMAPDI